MIEDEMDNPIKRARQNKKSKNAGIVMDMNAMVDLAFLLLTFFMLTTTMLKPKAIELVMPVPDGDDQSTEVLTIKESRAITLIPMPDNELFYYQGF
ncbi:MAG: biopolymer transporter ExbD [Saprospiraceae bacterium]|nr:biopolymer transporter ExbD [Saprospiraceae bacterium]